MATRVLILLLLVCITGCNGFGSFKKSDIEGQLRLIVVDQNPNQISFEKTVNFDWSDLWIIRPYTQANSISKEIGVPLDDIQKSKDLISISMKDGVNLFIFKTKENEFIYDLVSRTVLDFDDGYHIKFGDSAFEIIYKEFPTATRKSE